MKFIILAIIIGVVLIAITANTLHNTSTEKISDLDDSAMESSVLVSEQESSLPSDVELSTQACLGIARCFTGTVEKIVDGDTIKVDDNVVRFALASAPELQGFGGIESRDFIQTLCPIGSKVLVDEDDSQTEGSSGRMIGVIYCNGMNLNEELLDVDLGHLSLRFCDSSEFKNSDWAKKHGC